MSDPKIVTLNELCAETKTSPVLARKLLRKAAADTKGFPHLGEGRGSRTPWRWAEGSKALEEAKRALT